MSQRIRNNIKNVGVVFCTTLVFFSCQNSAKEVRDFLASRNLPVGKATELNHVYKDSGQITLRLNAPLLHDFSNRTAMPYHEFPKGIHMSVINRKTRDSITVVGDYAVTYTNTNISKIEGSVVIINHKENVMLQTPLMYWDQRRHYYFTKMPFMLVKTNEENEKDTIFGVGFESTENLLDWEMQQTKGTVITQQK